MPNNVESIAFEAGYLTLTMADGPPCKVAIREFLEAAVDSDDYADGSIDLGHLAAASIDGTAAKVVAAANVIGGIPLLYRIDIADATGNTDVVTTHKIKVLDFWIVNAGAAAHATLDTVQLKNTANAITDALAKTNVTEAVIKCATIDDAREDIAAGGKIRIAATKDTNVACTAYVLAVRTA